MPEDIPPKDDDEEFEDTGEGSERGVGDSEDEFDDDDEVDEDDENEDSPRGVGDDRSFTSEIGSEGGSQGDLEAERRRPRVTRGSEAGTTAETDELEAFHERRAGGGVGRARH